MEGAPAGLRTRSGHATFQAAPAKSWESGQRPRKLQPHEMPWARAARRAPSLAPQKSLAKPPADALASLHSGSDFDTALMAEEDERAKEEAERATAEVQHKDVGTTVSSPTCVFARHVCICPSDLSATCKLSVSIAAKVLDTMVMLSKDILTFMVSIFFGRWM